MAPAYDDRPDSLVPADGPLTAEDLRRVRFPLAFRGYRMAEVDALLDRLAEEREAADRGCENRRGAHAGTRRVKVTPIKSTSCDAQARWSRSCDDTI